VGPRESAPCWPGRAKLWQGQCFVSARKLVTRAGRAARLPPWVVGCIFMLALSPALALAQQPITFQYIYDDLNQLTKVIDSTGVVIQYVYDPVGNILQINRSTVQPGALTIFNVTPQSALQGGTITIQGQGFSPNPALDFVTIGGVSAAVVTATSTTLVVTVPAGATSGSITVIVGGVTATSPSPETVIPAPIITSVKPRVMQAGTTASVTVTGANLVDAIFSIPGSRITVLAATPTPDGTSTVLALIANATANGRFAVVASNGVAGSATLVTLANAFSAFVDPTLDPDGDGLPNGLELILGTDPFNADTDGDGFSDGVEVASGSDPLNPACTPLNCRLSGEVESLTVSAISTVSSTSQPTEADSVVFSALNSVLPTTQTHEADSVVFSMLNSVLPTTQMQEADSIVFSLNNTATSQSQLKSKSNPTTTSGRTPTTTGGNTPAPMMPPDSDGDGLSDDQERQIGTNPFNPDTDSDGYPDGLEVALGSDPLDPRSIPDIRPPAMIIVPLIDIENQAVFYGQAGRPAPATKGDQRENQTTQGRMHFLFALARFLTLFH